MKRKYLKSFSLLLEPHKTVNIPNADPPNFYSNVHSMNRFLDYNHFKNLHGITIFSCMENCKSYGGDCRSFSFSQAEGACYMSRSKRGDADEEKYVVRDGYVYYEQM